MRGRSVVLFLPECLGFIFFDLFSNLIHTGCRRGRTPERPLRQPPRVWPYHKARPLPFAARSCHVNIPRCVGCWRCTWRACHVQREQAGYSRVAELPKASRRGQRSQFGITRCCARQKFRSTVGSGSFPFRYQTRAGAERQGEDPGASDVPLGSRVRSPSSAGRRLAGIAPGEAEVEEPADSLTSGMRESRG